MSNLKISVITPSYNQGRFIKDTIETIMSQQYPFYEHIIIDGGSKDNSLDILKAYKHLNWVSEPDKGSANALNKGFAKATGDILTWLNSDDYYDEGVFTTVCEAFQNNPGVDFVYGNLTFVDENKLTILKDKTLKYSFDFLVNYFADAVRQPAIFFRRELLNKVGKLDETLKIVFDYDLFIRMLKVAQIFYIDKNFAFVRDYDETITKSNLRKQGLEILKVSRRNGGRVFNRLLLETIYRKLIFPNRAGVKKTK